MSLSCLSLPFLRRARLPGLWASGLPERARCRVSAAPVCQLPHVGRTLGDLGPCGSWSPPRALPEVRPEGGNAGARFPESSCGGRGVCGAHFRSVPASSAAFPRCLLPLRGGGSRCEGCVRAAWGPARSSRLAGACEPGFGLAGGVGVGRWAAQWPPGSFPSGRPPHLAGPARGRASVMRPIEPWPGTLLWQLVFSSFWGNAQNTLSEATGPWRHCFEHVVYFCWEPRRWRVNGNYGKTVSILFPSFFFFLTFLSSEQLRKFFCFFLFCISSNGKWKLHVNWLPRMCKPLLVGS